MRYVIVASRTAGSVFGAAQSLLKRDGAVVTYDTQEEAAAEVRRLMQGLKTPNVRYWVREEA